MKAHYILMAGLAAQLCAAPARAQDMLSELELALEAKGWVVDSNPPTYEIPMTDGEGNTFTFRGLSLIQLSNPSTKYPQAKLDVNSSQREAEIMFRDALPSPLNSSFQLIYVLDALSVDQQDVDAIDERLRIGGLTEQVLSNTPVEPTTWGRVKGLYR